MRESTIEAYLRKQVMARGGYCYKFVSPSEPGVPDRLILFPRGNVQFAEVKTELGVVSAKQNVQMRRIAALGLNVWIIRRKADVDMFIREAAGV